MVISDSKLVRVVVSTEKEAVCVCVFVFRILVFRAVAYDRIRVVAIAIEQPLQGVWSWPYFVTHPVWRAH